MPSSAAAFTRSRSPSLAVLRWPTLSGWIGSGPLQSAAVQRSQARSQRVIASRRLACAALIASWATRLASRRSAAAFICVRCLVVMLVVLLVEIEVVGHDILAIAMPIEVTACAVLVGLLALAIAGKAGAGLALIDTVHDRTAEVVEP